MPIFLIVRHGENDLIKQGRLGGRLPGVHLNEAGSSQAQATARMIAHFKTQADERMKAHKASRKKAPPQDKAKVEKPAEPPVWKIYSSPMERAMETAGPIAQALGLEIGVRPGLLETDCGEWAGKTVKSLSRRKIWKEVQNNPSQFRFPGGETFIECQERMVVEFEALRTAHAPMDTVICVSHADPIKLLVAHYLGLPFDNFQRLAIDPASITILYLDDKGCRLLGLNITPSSYHVGP